MQIYGFCHRVSVHDWKVKAKILGYNIPRYQFSLHLVTLVYGITDFQGLLISAFQLQIFSKSMSIKEVLDMNWTELIIHHIDLNLMHNDDPINIVLLSWTVFYGVF